MEHSEICFHGTVGQLQKELPPSFLRCHRGFIVNRDHILSVNRAEQMIELKNKIFVPLSRKYRDSFWEEVYGIREQE